MHLQKHGRNSFLVEETEKSFVHMFRVLDHDFAHLKAFSNYREGIFQNLFFSEVQYENYAAMYRNVTKELKKLDDATDTELVLEDYDLIAYNKLRVDFEYILELLQGVVGFLDQSEDNLEESDSELKIKVLREIITEFS